MHERSIDLLLDADLFAASVNRDIVNYPCPNARCPAGMGDVCAPHGHHMERVFIALMRRVFVKVT